MKKWNGYETTQVMGGKKKLPVGAYVCKVLEAREESYGWGSVLVIHFDIAEGEYKNFYREQYEKQDKNKKWKGVHRISCPTDDGTPKDERLKKAFKTFIHHIETSNKGYTWDWNETTLRGKQFGGVFGEKEYEIDGNSGFFTTMRYTCEVDRLDKVQLPKPLMLKKDGTSNTNTSNTTWEDTEGLPF